MSDEIKFVNLTPHEVVILSQNGENVVMRVPPSGTVARVSTKSEIICEVGGVPVRKVTYGDIEGLPEPKGDTIYIVSTIVLLALKEKGIHRNDVVSPDTNIDSVIRDPQGRVIGVKYFQVL